MKKVVVVDGFSSGKDVARKLYGEGCSLLHVASRSALDEYYWRGFEMGIYECAIVHAELTSTLEQIRRFEPDIIIAGAESGVLLADQLNDVLALDYANDFTLTRARRNKYEMINCVARAGLSAVGQCAVETWCEGKKWIETHNQYPVVIKPLESAGADGVYICRDITACERAFNTLLGTRNKLSVENKAVLIQEYLAGTEYVVNMVSLKGRQWVTEVVRYTKRTLETGNVVYDIDQLLDSTAPVYDELVAYTRLVVNSLGIKNGPSHAEVMYTATGPTLVEIAARTDGILRASVCAQTTQLGQIDAFVLSMTRPLEFERLLTSGRGYSLFKHTYNVALICTTEGVFRTEAFLNELNQLDSFFEAVFYAENGQKIGMTKDVFSQPGTVYLVHPDLAQIESDYAKIRNMELAGIYLEGTHKTAD